MTTSEEIFKTLMDGFCLARNGGMEYEDKRNEKHTADFIVSIICRDVKHPCAFEINQLKKSTKSGKIDPNDIGRIHKCVGQGSDQIRNTTKEKYPGIIVIYDNSMTQTLLWDGYAIWHAMFGHDIIQLDIQTGQLYHKIGGDRGLNLGNGGEFKRSHISGIARLVVTNCIYMDLFKNPYASNKMHRSFDLLFREKYHPLLDDHGELCISKWEQE